MNDSVAANKFNEGGWHIVERDMPKSAALLKEHRAKLGIADPHRVFQHLLKHRLKFARRTRDYLQHLGGRGLLLEGFAQFIQQTGIFDGNDGLSSKVSDQLDLLVGEWAHFLTIDGDHTD